MDLIYELGSVFASVLPLTFWNFLDIGVLWYIIYKIMFFMRDTRAGGLIKGMIIVVAAYLLANMLKMRAVVYLLDTVMDVGFFAIIVLFQPELRRTIEKIGHSGITKLNVFTNETPSELISKWNTAIDAVCDACEDLSASYTGALIVFEMETKLGEQIDTGTILDASPSKELFGTIFFTKTPLHDGAVIIRDGMVHAAACFLPKPTNEERINKELGSRHRAAIGMSENSDAIIVVVSEETGTISVAENGKLQRRLTKDDLKKYLRDRIFSEKLLKMSSSQNNDEEKHLFKRGGES